VLLPTVLLPTVRRRPRLTFINSKALQTGVAR